MPAKKKHAPEPEIADFEFDVPIKEKDKITAKEMSDALFNSLTPTDLAKFVKKNQVTLLASKRAP